MNEIIYPQGCKDIQIDIPNDELIRRLKKIQQTYQNLEQTSEEKYKQLAIYLGSEIFLKHENEDVQLLVACCLADIFRVFAPESPFEDPDNLKNIFIFLANQLKGLRDYANTSFKRYFYLLENLECVKTFQLCLELDDCQEIITLLFQNVFKIISDKHNIKVQTLLFDLLHPPLNESDSLAPKVVEILLLNIIEPQKSTNKEAYNLAVNLIKKGAEPFEYIVQSHLNNVILMGKAEIPTIVDKMCLIIYELNQIRPSLLELALPQLEYKINSSDLKERREFTRLLSKMFSEKDSKIAATWPQLWLSFLDRFSDANDDIRKICVSSISDFLINHPEQNEQIYEEINRRSLDTEETIRLELVEEILKTIKSDNSFIVEELLNVIKDRILDIKIRVRKQALQGLAVIYKKVHSKLSNKELFEIVKWIPSKIMHVHFQESADDKLVVERLLNSSIVPYSLSSQEKMAQLYYAYLTFDDYSTMALMEIIKDKILLQNSIKIIIDILDDDEKNEEKRNETKLHQNITIVAQNLLDFTKGQELMKHLIKLFKENINLKNHFKNLVNPNCSCTKSLELISLILGNLNSLNPSNLSLARRLIERMSSIVIDDESFECLLKLVEIKIFNFDKNNDLDYIEDDGEKGLLLVNQILKKHPNRLIKESIYEKFLTFLRSKKEPIVVNTLKILSSNFLSIKDKLEDLNEQYLAKLKAYIRTGTPKQAKYSIRCIYSNFSNYEVILSDIYKEIIKEISIKNEKTFLTLLVSLGHLAFYIPEIIGLDMKSFITETIFKDILIPTIERSISGDDEISKNNSKLAGKWCENEDDLPFETRIQIEGIKVATRWCLGLKREAALPITLNLFSRIIEINNSNFASNKSEPEKARIRLVCGSQVLKLAHEVNFRPQIGSNLFHLISRLIIDPVSSVCDIFYKKLHKSLKMSKLPLQFISILALTALDTNRDRKSRAKKSYFSLIKLIHDQNKKRSIMTAHNDDSMEIKIKSLPENSLPYSISLLAHNCKIESLKDEISIKHLKECVAFTLDPLLDNPDGYQIVYIKKLLNSIKNSDDALCRSRIKQAKSSDQLKYGSDLMKINKNLATICEIAFFHIHSKLANLTGKEYPLEIKLNNLFYLPKESSQIESDLNDKETGRELETTLGILKDLDGVDEKSSNKKPISRKRKIKQRNADEEDDEDNDDENSSIHSITVNKGGKTSGSVQAKKITPNSSVSSISSSAKSSPSKSTTTRVNTSPFSKKKKIEDKLSKVLTLSSRESSRESSPVVRLSTPRPEVKGVSNSEILITRIDPTTKLADLSKEESKASPKNKNSKGRAKSKAENGTKTKLTARKKGKKASKSSDEDDESEEKSEEEEEEKEEKETEEVKKGGKKVQQKKKDVEEKVETEEDSSQKTTTSETGVYTLRLRNRK